MTCEHPLLHDNAFWETLEHLVSAYLSGHQDASLRCYWIDGFIPLTANRRGSSLEFGGNAWICKNQLQAEWTFQAIMPDEEASSDRLVSIRACSIDAARRVLHLEFAL